MKFIRIVDLDGKVKKVSFDDFVDHEFMNFDFNTILKVADIHEEMRMPLYHELLYMATNPYLVAQLETSMYFKDLVSEVLNSNNKMDKIFLITYHYHSLMYDIYNNENDIIEDIKEHQSERISGIGKVQLLIDLYRQFNMMDYNLINDSINPLINEDIKVLSIAMDKASMSKEEMYRLMTNIKCAYYEELNNIKKQKDEEKIFLN